MWQEDLFRRSSTSDAIFLWVGCAVLIANAIGFLRMISFRQLCARAQSLMRTAAQAFGSRTAAAGDDDEVDLMVKRMMQQMTLDRFRMVNTTLCAIKMVVLGGVLLNTARQQRGRVLLTGDLIVILEQCVFALPVLFPGLLSWKTIDVFYTSSVLLSTLYFMPGVSEPDKVMWRLGSINIQVAALLVGRATGRAVLPSSLLYATVTSISAFASRQALPIGPALPIMLQILIAMGVPPCCHLLELGMEAAIRQGLEVNATKELLAAVSAVLRSCCDVVVELDFEGCIMSPAWDLGVFLLRGCSCNLQTTQFTRLLADEEDKSIFLKRLCTPKATDLAVAEALHTRLRDADGSLLQVELFTCPFRHLSGQARNLVGVRESSRTASSNEAQLADRHQQLNTAAAGGVDDPTAARGVDPMAAGGVDPTASSDEERAPSVTSSLSSHSARSCSSGTRENLWAATLVVDSTSDRLSIHGCSLGFQARVGRLAPGVGLMDVVKEAEDFANWMKMAATYGADWPKVRVTLNLRQGVVKATVRVTHEEEDGSVDRKHVQLLFSKIAKTKVHSDGCSRFKPHTNYRGTPVLHMTL